jgi:putative ABC transport system permease protein
VALTLAALGLYALLASSVAARAREIGLRMALGARATEVGRMVIGEGVTLTATGWLGGAGLALIGGRWLETLLYGVTSRDPLTFTIMSVTLSAIALFACLVPAIRAARVDPARVLRDE